MLLLSIPSPPPPSAQPSPAPQRQPPSERGTKPHKLSGTVTLYAVLVTIAILLLLNEIPQMVGNEPPISGTQVAAQAGQLQRLARRTRVAGPGVEGPLAVLWTYGNSCTRFQGLITAADGASESQLWLRAGADAAHPLRNPERPHLPSLWIHRDPYRSDLVPPHHPRRLWVEIAQALDQRPGQTPADALRLNNLTGPRALDSAHALGKPLGDLALPKGCTADATDPATLDQLASMLRVSFCSEGGASPATPCPASATTLYRGLRPDVYRLDAFAQGASCGTLSLALEVKRNASGGPSQLVMQRLPATPNLQCPVQVEIVSAAPPTQAMRRQSLLRALPGPVDSTARSLDLAPWLKASTPSAAHKVP